MSFAKKFNRNSVHFDVNTEAFNFCSLQFLNENYKGETFRMLGVFVNSKLVFGDSPCAIVDGALVNLPEHMTPVIQNILNDTEAVESIKCGVVGFTVREYQSKNPKAKGKTCYTIDWVDIEPDKQTITVEAHTEEAKKK